jgi:hypothetical protein
MPDRLDDVEDAVDAYAPITIAKTSAVAIGAKSAMRPKRIPRTPRMMAKIQIFLARLEKPAAVFGGVVADMRIPSWFGDSMAGHPAANARHALGYLHLRCGPVSAAPRMPGKSADQSKVPIKGRLDWGLPYRPAFPPSIPSRNGCIRGTASRPSRAKPTYARECGKFHDES